MKLDLRKAYDTIDWRFIRYMLKGLKFPEMIIQRIMECISTPRFSIMINGSPYGYFASQRGLRQGDPVSPYLFVLAMEYFSKLLKNLHSVQNFRFHAHCKELKLAHLCFADDIMLFCRDDINSPIILKEFIDKFANASGLRVNVQKSMVFLCGVPVAVKRILLEKLGFIEGKLPIKYLGLPLISSDCSPIIAKMQRKIHSWSAKCLTYAGRVVLIKSVLFHYQVFWSNAILLPKSVIHCIEALCRNYLWSGVSDGKKMPLVAWENICMPRCEGGLGILQLDVWNKAALGKQLWKIIANSDCLWVKWAKVVYMKGKSLWTAAAKDNHPWSWRKILKLRSSMLPHIECKIGDGRQFSLFYDNWLRIGTLNDLTTNAAQSCGENLTVRIGGTQMEDGTCRPVFVGDSQLLLMSSRVHS